MSMSAPMMTALAPNECLVDVRFPEWDECGPIGTGFHEVASRAGDFAIVAAAAWAECSSEGIHYGLGLGGIEDRPIGTSGSLEDTSSLAERVSRELIEGLEAMDDNRASAAYRRHLAGHLGQQVLQQVMQELAS